MGSMGVVVVHVGRQAGDEILGRSEVASFEPATSQGTEPQFDLVEPRTVFGREMKDVLVIRVRQEGASFGAGKQAPFVERLMNDNYTSRPATIRFPFPFDRSVAVSDN
jgi:hypothetical protein